MGSLKQPTPAPADSDLPVLGWRGSDEALLEQAKADRRVAASLLFDRYAQDVNRMVWSLVGPDSERDDMVNETFVNLLNCIGSVRDASKLRSWVISVTVRTVRMQLRRRRTRRRFHSHIEHPEEFAGNSATPDKAALLRRVFGVLDQLSTDLRLVFTLRYIEEQPLASVAELTGMSLSTVKRRLRRAEKRFTTLARLDPELNERLQQSQRWVPK